MVGERGLFAPALLVARPALTGFVPQPSHLIFGARSYESTRLQSERRAARVSPPVRGRGTEDASRPGKASLRASVC